MISNLWQNKNIKWLYWVPVVIGSVYIIELILGLSLLSGIFTIFSDINTTIDERSKANERSAAFEYTDQLFYEKTYDHISKGYQELEERAIKFPYPEWNIDFRDRLQARGSRLGKSTYAYNKKKLLDHLNDRYKTKKYPIQELVKEDGLSEFSDLTSRYKAGVITDAELEEYNKQSVVYINGFKTYLDKVKSIVNSRQIVNEVRRKYIQQLKLRLADNDQNSRQAIIAYIYSTIFDQLTNDNDFITYAALHYPNYEFQQQLGRTGHYGAFNENLVIAKIWPLIADLEQDQQHFKKRNIAALNGEDLQEIYNYMVVYNKAKLTSIPAKHPPVIAAANMSTVSAEANHPTETTAEVTND